MQQIKTSSGWQFSVCFPLYGTVAYLIEELEEMIDSYKSQSDEELSEKDRHFNRGFISGLNEALIVAKEIEDDTSNHQYRSRR